MFESITPQSETPVVSYTVDPASRQITLHRLDRNGPTPLGTFSRAADAWSALDAIDAPAANHERAAA